MPRRSGAPSHIPTQPAAALSSGAAHLATRFTEESFSPSAVTTPVTPGAHSAVAGRPFAAAAKPHPARVARGPAFIPHTALQLVIGYRRGLSQPVNCLSTCQTFDLRNALSGVGINDRVCALTPDRVKSITRRCHRGTSPEGPPDSAVRRPCPGGLPTRCGPPPLPGVHRCGPGLPPAPTPPLGEGVAMFTLLTNGDRSQLDDRPARHLRPGQPPRPRN